MRQDNEILAYFRSCQGLRSDDPSIRRPAISTLITLAHQAIMPIRVRARAALTQEFGPFAVTDGLSGCAAPPAAVYACSSEGRDCRTCAWAWRSAPCADTGSGGHRDRPSTAAMHAVFPDSGSQPR